MTTTKFTPAVYRDSTHTAIVIDRTDVAVHFIPLATLRIEKLSAKAFDKEWTAYPEYPVRRAAEVYLGAGQYRAIPAQTCEHLNGIVANPATAYPTFESTQGNSKMATSPKASPAARNGINSVVDSSKKPAATPLKGKPTPVAAKAVPAKAAPAKAVPAKAAPVAAKAAPAAAKGKPAPAPAPAPAKVATKSPVKAAPAATDSAKPGRTRLPSDVAFKVVDTSRVKRGFLMEFVEKAQQLKKFTRDQIEAEFAHREANDTNTYFPYCVGKGIFAHA